MKQTLSFLGLMLFCISTCTAGVIGNLNPFNIRIVPSIPGAGETFIVRWDTSICRDIGGLRFSELQGDDIVVEVEFHDAPPPPGCDPAITRFEWEVGPFPEGDYVFVMRGFSQPNGESTIIAEFPLQIAPFSAQSPAVVSATSPFALFVGVALMLLLAFRFPRTRRN
jgi:hypothetical protein